MIGKLCIAELEVSCRIGVSEHERAQPRLVWVNIELELEFPQTDELEATVDYATLAARVKSFCADRAWKLIETMAVDLAELVLRESPAFQVTIEVRKAALAGARFVAAKVIRNRGSAP